MDTKFSVAVHVLVMISESPVAIDSNAMAESVGTNSSYIRKVLALLKRAGIIENNGREAGYSLTCPPDELSLLEIYEAVCDDGVHLLDIHRNPNDRCLVGHNIRPMLTEMFSEAEDAFRRSLSGRTLADCISRLYRMIEDQGHEV